MVMSVESVEQQRAFGIADRKTLARRLVVARTASIKRRAKRLEVVAFRALQKLRQEGPPIRAAAVTTPGKALAVRAVTALLGPGRGVQAQAVIRQQLGRVPLPVKVAGAIGAGTVGTELITGRTPAGLARGLIGQAFGERGLGIPRGAPQTQTGRSGMARGSALAVGGQIPPSHQVVRTWQTFPGGPVFARLADGHIAVQKKDGTVKHFRPYRPVVIPRKWNARSMSRVATALKRQRKTATKIMQITGGMPGRRK